MTVRIARKSDIYAIARLTLAYYERKNRDFGYSRYITTLAEAKKIIHERIHNEVSNIKYAVLEEGDDIIGFISFGNEGNIGEILQLVIFPEFQTEPNIKSLLDWTLIELKSKGVSKIYLEMSEMDRLIRAVFSSYNGKIVNLQGRIDLS